MEAGCKGQERNRLKTTTPKTFAKSFRSNFLDLITLNAGTGGIAGAVGIAGTGGIGGGCQLFS